LRRMGVPTRDPEGSKTGKQLEKSQEGPILKEGDNRRGPKTATVKEKSSANTRKKHHESIDHMDG